MCIFGNRKLDVVVKISAKMAGILIATNNKELAAAALPAAKAILGKATGDSDNAAMNKILKEGIVTLLDKVKMDAKAKAEIEIVLVALGISVPDNVFPALDNDVIAELVEAFIEGVEAGVA